MSLHQTSELLQWNETQNRTVHVSIQNTCVGRAFDAHLKPAKALVRVPQADCRDSGNHREQ